MRKLLSAGFARLWKSAFFWGEVLVMSGFMVCLMILKYREQAEYDTVYTLDLFLPGAFVFIGLFTSLFAASFLGTEYSDGTLRNKLVMGHGRAAVYLSNLVLCLVSSLAVCAAALAVTAALGIPLYGLPVKPLPYTLGVLGTGVMVTAAFSGIFTMVAMVNTRKSASSTLCVLGFFLLMLAAVYIMVRLEEPETVGGLYVMYNGVTESVDSYPNPAYLKGAQRTLFVFFRDFLPTGQGLQLGEAGSAVGMELRLALPLYSLIITAATTFLGIGIFLKKDLK